MVSFKKIVCALDLSDLSERVAQYAISLAKAYDGEIIVIYATPPMNQYAALDVHPNAIEGFMTEIAAKAKKQMEKTMTTLFAGLKASALIESGSPAEEIVRVAQENKADVIVMGTHGRKGVDLILFGSVAEKVVKSSKTPVLTIHPNP